MTDEDGARIGVFQEVEQFNLQQMTPPVPTELSQTCEGICEL